MAVKDFIPTTDAKQTIERSVAPRKTTEELTTIISPGKPSPASGLEDKKKTAKKKTKRKAAKAKSSSVKISQPEKDSVLIITEKPQAALKISQALAPGGSADKFSENNVPWYEFSLDGKKLIVASAVGHLYNLTYSKGQVGWPIFKTEWVPSHTQKGASFTKRYLSLLKKLSKRAEEIIIATDYDIEGEVIGWNALRFICQRETAKRMKYSTLTKSELQNSFSNLMPEPDWGQAYAGESRHIADWLYGINLSRALMSAIKTTGNFKILSIGRVQGPALKIIVDREREISSFKPEPFWQVIAIVKETDAGLLEPAGGCSYKHPKDIFKKSDLKQFKDLKEAQAQTKNSQESLPPPTPFDLTTLQREAYRLHRIPPSQVLKIAQKLYLDGLISYPRTSSQKIPDSIQPKSILKALTKQFPQVSKATRPKPLEGPKADPAHPSIYPTGELPNKIQDQEQKIYNIIARRFISCFCQDAKISRRRTTLLALPEKKLNFTSSGLSVLEKNWLEVYPSIIEEKDIPDLKGLVKLDQIKFEQKETQPPKRYTPTSLVTTLEKKNLGTKATRSSIVDTLFDRGYLDGKSIKATPLGIKLIESLEKYSPIIIDENLTADIENEMQTILELKSGQVRSPQRVDEFRGDSSKSESNSTKIFETKKNKFIQKVQKVLTDISKDFKTQETNIGKELQKGLQGQWEKQAQDNTLNSCPTCKQGNLRITYSKKTKRSFISCSAYPKCTQTYSLPPGSLIKPSGKDCESCKFPKLLSIKKGRKPWEFCFNPECKTNVERFAKYKAKQEN